jgi:hypothetical protein
MRGMLKRVLPVLMAGMVALPAVAMDLTRNGRLILLGDVNSSAELWADAPNRQGLCLVRLRDRVVHKIPCENSFRPKSFRITTAVSAALPTSSSYRSSRKGMPVMAGLCISSASGMTTASLR